jgi:hypothetical protein
MSIQQKKQKRAKQLKVAKQTYYQTEKGKECLRRSYVKRATTPYGKAQQTRLHMRANSIKRGLKWNDEWWSNEKIADIMENGRCAITGIKFTIGTVGRTGIRNPFKASPDRIDITKGYEPSNVRWVVFIYNLMRSNFKDEDVDLFIKSLRNIK